MSFTPRNTLFVADESVNKKKEKEEIFVYLVANGNIFLLLQPNLKFYQEQKIAMKINKS